MIGVDIISVKRVSKLAESDTNHRVFTAQEIAYANTKSQNVLKGEVCSQRENTLAGLFAAKEAFMKALGLGLGDYFLVSDIEIGHFDSGAPYIVITEKISSYLKPKGLERISLSISHDCGYAMAAVEIC